MKRLIKRFLAGQCPECNQGDSLVAYLAFKLNCPVNRINSKLVNSISLLQVLLLNCNHPLLIPFLGPLFKYRA